MSPPKLHPQVGSMGRAVGSSGGRFGKTVNRHRLPKRIQCLEHDFSFQIGLVWEGKSQNNNKSSTTAWSWRCTEREQRETKALVGSVRSASNPTSLFLLLHVRNELGIRKRAKINQNQTHGHLEFCRLGAGSTRRSSWSLLTQELCHHIEYTCFLSPPSSHSRAGSGCTTQALPVQAAPVQVHFICPFSPYKEMNSNPMRSKVSPPKDHHQHPQVLPPQNPVVSQLKRMFSIGKASSGTEKQLINVYLRFIHLF